MFVNDFFSQITTRAMSKQIPIEISLKSREKIYNFLTNSFFPENYFLKIFAKGGGCAGISFHVASDIQKEQDLKYDFGNFAVLIAKKDIMFLYGKHLVFIDSFEFQGFVVCEIEEAQSLETDSETSTY